MADSIDVLVKLFDTLKSSTDRNENSTQQLIGQQHELINYIKNLPIRDLHDALKEHSKDSKVNIDGCSDTVSLKSKDLMTEIKKVNAKVSKMILIVAVAFTIVTGTYVVIRSVSDDNSQFNKWKKTSDKAHDQILENVTIQIESLRNEIQKRTDIEE